jgi:TrmH family RNA methyltransferase
MITSRQNSKIKQIRKLNTGSKFRSEAGQFAVEGIRILEEAQQSGIKPEWVIFTEDLDQRGQQLLASYQKQQIPCEPVTTEVMEAASDTKTPQGMLGVFPLIELPLPKSLNLLVILDSLRDPGNLGTLMRTCLASNVDGLLLAPGSVDPFSPKVVRSAMGAHFRLPILSISWSRISALTQDVDLLLAEMNKGTSLWDTNLTEPVGIILGNEAHGPSDHAISLATRSIHIPTGSRVESLNVAAAGAVLLFEILRQRSMVNPKES